MPRDTNPRIVIRLSPAEHETLDEMCKAANVALSGFARECILRYGTAALRDLREGTIRARRRDPTKPQIATEPKSKQREAIPGLMRASELLPMSGSTGPDEYADVMLARQQRLNRGIDRSREP